jgi:nitrite reductase/ring-hydroxylating ferredoxin subunit
MSVRDFDDDIAALLAFVAARTGVIAEQIGAVGFCLGGHVGFRAALSPLVKATALFYPTGLHDGDLAGDGDAGSLARAGEIGGPLLTIFGRIDPHTDATGRETVQRGLDAAGIRHRISLYDAEHAFMRDVGARYDPSATDAAFAESIAWFREAGLTRVFLCAVDTLTEGEPKRIAVSGYEPLTVVGIAGRYFALSDECSHGMASLSDGWVEDGNLICSLHSGGFSLETGEATVPPCTDAIRRYDVVRDGDALFLAS